MGINEMPKVVKMDRETVNYRGHNFMLDTIEYDNGSKYIDVYTAFLQEYIGSADCNKSENAEFIMNRYIDEYNRICEEE